MPFKYNINEDMGIVVIKGEGKISNEEIFEEIEKAIQNKRGKDIPRRLIDMSNKEFTYTTEEAKKILKAFWKEARILHIDKIALLFNNIPEAFDFKQIVPLLDTSYNQIRMFVEKQKAIEFLKD